MTPDTPNPASDFGPKCPVRVKRASMIHEWKLVTFLHWGYNPELVQPLLPPGLRVDTYNGLAWVGLVPFVMEVRPARGPALPWISHFCETNVRTYATAPDGTTGVWFLSLDAARLPAVATARTTYKMPYFWSDMNLNLSADGTTYTYTCKRRWPGPRGAASVAKIRVGTAYSSTELSEFDHFLTARWRLYSSSPRGLRYAVAEHAPWALHQAEALRVDDDLVSAAGLPAPDTEPIAHWSPGTQVRIGFPHKLATVT